MELKLCYSEHGEPYYENMCTKEEQEILKLFYEDLKKIQWEAQYEDENLKKVNRLDYIRSVEVVTVGQIKELLEQKYKIFIWEKKDLC